MKIVLSESQYQRLIETKEKGKILKFPSLEFFDENQFKAWHMLQRILKKKGNPQYSIDGKLDLGGINITLLGNPESFGNLVSIGQLNLEDVQIKELNSLVRVDEKLFLGSTLLESLPNLEYVGDELDLNRSPIVSLPKLKYVGGVLDLTYAKIKNLDSLVSVNSIFLIGTPIKSLGNIKVLRGTLNLSKSEIEDLRGLESVGRNWKPYLQICY